MKKILLLIIGIFTLVLNSANLLGQGWDYLYTPPVGQFENKNVSIDQSTDGNIVVYSEGYTHFLKIDSLGNSTWQAINSIQTMNTFTGLEDFAKDNLIATSDSNYILVDDNNNTNNIATTGFQQLHLARLDNNLDTVWVKKYYNSLAMGAQFIVNDVKQLNDGHILVLLYDNNGDEVRLMKFNYSNGNIIWNVSYFSSAQSIGLPYTYHGKEVIENTDGTLTLLTQVSIDTLGYVRLIKLNASGNFLWAKNFTATKNIPWQHSERTLARNFIGETVFSFRTFDIATNQYQTVVIKTDVQGNEIWRVPISQSQVYDLILTSENDILVCGQAANNANKAAITKLRFDDGTVVWDKTYLEQFSSIGQPFHLQRILETNNNRFFAAGMAVTISGKKIYGVMIDSMGNTFTNVIQGMVYFDANGNCIFNNNETHLNAPIILQATQSADTIYTITDSLGNYSIRLKPGNYQIRPITFSSYWNSCPSPILPLLLDSVVSYDVGLQALINCSDLSVSITTPNLIRCFSNTYYVNYSNFGTVGEPNTYIEIEMDSFLIVNNASIPFTQSGTIYTFYIGNLGINQIGQFTINTTVNCNSLLGQTHCVEANIYPQQLCLPNGGTWDDASIIVDATCVGNNLVRFTIENIGTQPMTQARQYHVIEDQILQYQGIFMLPAGADTSWTVLANPNSVYVIEAQQEFTHPNADNEVSDFAYGCNDSDSIPNVPINQFPLDDSDNYTDIDCQQNVGSFDPNDKQGFPIGYGENHFIEKNDAIEYLIRFQNTGSYLAFNVIVEDEIDTEFLDLSTLKLQNSSHPYSVSIVDGKILKFLFLNIMLPDSNTNEPASHGFIRFRIGQRANNPLGTIIENSADIFFDFNDAVVTNTTFHTVGEYFILAVSTQPIKEKLASVKVFPNPFTTQATFEIDTKIPYQNLTLTVYNVMGQAVKTVPSNGNNRLFLDRNDLTSGIYFYQIQSDGLRLDSGKLIVR
jgi:hypothetical protein